MGIVLPFAPAAVISGIVAIGAYWMGVLPALSVFIGISVFSALAFNLARAEIAELKIILDSEVPGWRESNADWASTWDWNRQLKRQLKRREKLESKQPKRRTARAEHQTLRQR
jgi:hypothetical protein